MDINTMAINNPSILQNLDIPLKPKVSTSATQSDKKVTKVNEEKPEKSGKTAYATSKDAKEIAANFNKMLEIVGSGKVEFKVHEGTQKVMIMVVDKVTDEVVREIPPEQTLNASAKFREVLNLLGVLMDEKV
jgi:flagellar protein FlaG